MNRENLIEYLTEKGFERSHLGNRMFFWKGELVVIFDSPFVTVKFTGNIRQMSTTEDGWLTGFRAGVEFEPESGEVRM